MKKEVISTKNAPGAVGPYSQGIKSGNMCFLSGQLPIDPVTGIMPETVEEQTVKSLENVKAILASQGRTLDSVVKTTVFLSDIADFAAMNKIYAEYFAEPYPARSCFAVKDLPKGAKVEIEVISID